MAPALPPYTGRLAPAPTGALHVGNARTFLAAWLRARQAGGRLLLRLEDLDHPRVKPGAAAGTYADLAWLGLDWDEGADRSPWLAQSRRMPLYRAILGRWRADGLVYPCRCTRREWTSAGLNLRSAPQEGDPREHFYPGACRPPPRTPGSGGEPGAAPARAAPPAWRLRLDRLPSGARVSFSDAAAGFQSGDLARWSGDFLVARDPDCVSYTLAVVADDHHMGVTEAVRGDDLLPDTQRQLALYDVLGWKPPAFFHVPLVVGPDGRRLAKRHGDSRLSAWRLGGRDPGRLVAWLARSLGIGWPAGAPARPSGLLGRFDPSRLPRDRVVWDARAEREAFGAAVP